MSNLFFTGLYSRQLNQNWAKTVGCVLYTICAYFIKNEFVSLNRIDVTRITMMCEWLFKVICDPVLRETKFMHGRQECFKTLKRDSKF